MRVGGAPELGAGQRDTSVLPLPLAHAYGLLVFCGGFHRDEGARTILMRWFDPAGWVRLAATHGVQSSARVPSIIQMLLSQPLEEADRLRRHCRRRGGGVAGGRRSCRSSWRGDLTATHRRGVRSHGGGDVNLGEFAGVRAGSAAWHVLRTGCEVSIQDDSGAMLPAGQDGEICVRSPGVMSGYWHSPDSAATVLAGGWLHTGDIGHLDADGYLYVVDRKKDLILRGGFNVFPRDVEDALVAHPAVALAGVVGRPDARLGEEVVAFVSLRPGASATVEELTEHARQHLGANKYPRQITIVPAIPLTSVGKLDRKKLRQWVTAGPAQG